MTTSAPAVQLLLFADPRDGLLEVAWQEIQHYEWYQDPDYGQIRLNCLNGGAIWYVLHRRNIEIDLNYCREWLCRRRAS